MKYRPLKKEKLYDVVATRIEELTNKEAGTEEAMELKCLTKLLIKYEKRKLQAV